MMFFLANCFSLFVLLAVLLYQSSLLAPLEGGDDEHKAAGFRLNSILSLAAVSIVSYCGTTTTED